MIQKKGQLFRFVEDKFPDFILNSLENYKSDAVAMVVAAKAHCFPKLHTDASLNYPMEMTVKMTGIGRVAVSVLRSLRHKASQELLFEDEIVLVNVDKRSRKPVPFDKEFMEKCSKCCDNKVIPRFTSPPKPSGEDEVFHCQRQAVSSDLDHLNHVNQQNFLKFSLDAMSLFMKDNRHWDSLLVKEIISVHKGEVKEGDIMDIYMWQSKAPNVLHFQIEMKSKVACNVTVQFYSKDMCSKL